MTQQKIYKEVSSYLKKGTKFLDVRHIVTLAWMIAAVIGSKSVNQAEWGSYVQSRAQKEDSNQKRWRRFLNNGRVKVEKIYVPLILQAISELKEERLYLALDTTVLWNKYCFVYLSVVVGGRGLPLLWMGLEHASASVAWEKYSPLLERAKDYLHDFSNIMLLADRGFANQNLMGWLNGSHWNWAIRLPADTLIYGVRRRGFGYNVRELYPPRREAVFYLNVQVWEEARFQAHLALASVPGAKDKWAILTNEEPSLETFWQYGLRFRIEHLFLDSKSGAFQWQLSRVRSVECLERLYLVIAIATLFSTLVGSAVEFNGPRSCVDAHYRRGLSFLKIGLRWLTSFVHKNFSFLRFDHLPVLPSAPCFASLKARDRYYLKITFSFIREHDCAM